MVDSEKWINNPPYLGNGARYEVSYYYSQEEVESIHRYRNW